MTTDKDDRIKLVAALGNIGAQYADTRHNIAWQMLECLPFFSELSWKSKFSGEYASYDYEGERIYFIMPHTYMNLSGKSIAPAMQFFKIEPHQVLVVHDDLEQDFGLLSFKEGGGLAGHNGLRSIASALGTRDFKRMRLGISRPSHGDITSYVLGKFHPDEQAVLPTYLENAAKSLELSFTAKFPNLVKKYRKRDMLTVASKEDG